MFFELGKEAKRLEMSGIVTTHGWVLGIQWGEIGSVYCDHECDESLSMDWIVVANKKNPFEIPLPTLPFGLNCLL